MILDIFENTGLYKGAHGNLDVALDHIMNVDLDRLEPGKHDVQGEDVYLIVKEGETRLIAGEDDLLEAHVKYVDLHYVIEGTEQIGFASLKGQNPVRPYDEEDDYALYKTPYEVLTLEKGMFAVFYPDDLHLPEISLDAVSSLKKVVVKIRL